MNALKEYDVLRLIEHKQICYVSSDNVKGTILATWMKYHPDIKKEQVIQWIHQLVNQLACIHKCRGNPSYQYVNPYCVLVSEEENLCFLDTGATSNREIIKISDMKRVCRYFLSEETDLYGLGKTIQYILNFTEVRPGFSKAEERQLQKIVSKCIHPDKEKRFGEISDVQKELWKLQIK